METVSSEPLGSESYCSECGRKYAAADVVRFGGSVVCAECKPRFLQRMREGAPTSAAVQYGGFWRRTAALLIDGLIITAIYIPLIMLTGHPLTSATLGWALGLNYIISIVINASYQGYFLSQKGATPGKMVMGLKVVTADGQRLSVGRAIARYFSYIIDSATLGIGFIMVAFDSQKRALHDYICSTRVIRG